ncbi:hypothetical protein ACIP1T_28200 [Pseudomonas japonica]|uniref:hypothetical protein n=1 Tax=Pseudomonas japonica TaxID=256466 RepID=UPI00380301DF
MLESVCALPIWQPLFWVFIAAGILGWAWSVLYVVVPAVDPEFAIQPTPGLLKLTGIVSHPVVVCVLIAGTLTLVGALLSVLLAMVSYEQYGNPTIWHSLRPLLGWGALLGAAATLVHLWRRFTNRYYRFLLQRRLRKFTCALLSRLFACILAVGSTLVAVATVKVAGVSLEINKVPEACLMLLALLASPVFYYLVLGRKGPGLPLGHGLSITIESAPRIDPVPSSAVLCFHVKGRFDKRRREITKRLVKAVQRVGQTSCDHDFVLKSWIFAEHDVQKSKHVARFRIWMARIRTLWVCTLIQGLLVAALLWSDKGNEWARVSAEQWGRVAVLLAIMLPALVQMIRYTVFAKRTMKHICIRSDAAPGEFAEALAAEIEGRVANYRVLLIRPRPLSIAHLLFLSLSSPRVVMSCSGAESGLILRRVEPLDLLNPAQPAAAAAHALPESSPTVR